MIDEPARLQRYLPAGATPQALQAGAQHCLPAVATRQRCGRAGREATGKTYLDIEDLQVRAVSEKERRWAVAEAADEYGEPNTEPRTLNT